MPKNKTTMSLGELRDSGRFYWIKSYETVRKWVIRDLNAGNILKTVVIGDNKGKRYYIKTENIHKFVKAFENGTVWNKNGQD